MGRFTGLCTYKPVITNPNNSGAGGLYATLFLRARGFKLHNHSSVTSEANCTRVTHTPTHRASLQGKDWWWRWKFVWNSSNFNPVRTFPYLSLGAASIHSLSAYHCNTMNSPNRCLANSRTHRNAFAPCQRKLLSRLHVFLKAALSVSHSICATVAKLAIFKEERDDCEAGDVSAIRCWIHPLPRLSNESVFTQSKLCSQTALKSLRLSATVSPSPP